MRSFNLLLIVSVVLSTFQTAIAAKYDFSWIKVSELVDATACKSAVAKSAIYCPKDNYYQYACQCEDPVALGAYVYCGYTETKKNTKSRKNFEKYFMMKCPNLTHSIIDAAYENVTKYITTADKVAGFNVSLPSRVPIKYNTTHFKIQYKTTQQTYGNLDNGKFFGIGLLAYWLAIFTIFAIYRCLCLMNLSRFVTNNKIAKFMQANIFFKPFIGKKYKTSYFLGMVPITSDVIIITGFITINIVGCFWDINYYDKNVYWPAKPIQLGILYGDRGGWLAMFTMILTFMFAGRNTIFLWCTGWNFESFLTYHKWIARATMFNVILHSIAYWVNGIYMHDMADRNAGDWYRWGCVATVAGCAILIQACYPLRKYSYEIFLYGHIILAVFFAVGTWIHLVYCEIEYFMFPVIAFWCFDRFIRIVRMIAFGGFKQNKISILNDENMVLTVTNYNKKLFKPLPGNFVFVYFGLKNTFWESHPFTIFSADANCIKILIKAKRGCTRRVYNAIVASGSDSLDIRVCLEGPYGISKQNIVSKSENILMYSTNTAVAGPHTYMKSYIDKGITQGKNVKFYWSIRHWETLDFLADELQYFSKQDNLSVIVYISKFNEYKFGKIGTTPQKYISSRGSDVSTKDDVAENVRSFGSSGFSSFEHVQQLLPNIEFREGRLPILETITNDIEECLDNTHTTVMTCGHPEFCDEARSAVISNITRCKKKSIELIDELQVW